MTRDYTKFLNDSGKLHVRYLPRQTYTKLVRAHGNRDEVIDEVFEQLYLTWDLNQVLATQQRRGEEPDRALAARTVLDNLDDQDWWRANAAFEKVLIRDFMDVAEDHAELLDPVYDEQEAKGWQDQPG